MSDAVEPGTGSWKLLTPRYAKYLLYTDFFENERYSLSGLYSQLLRACGVWAQGGSAALSALGSDVSMTVVGTSANWDWESFL